MWFGMVGPTYFLSKNSKYNIESTVDSKLRNYYIAEQTIIIFMPAKVLQN